MWNGKKILENVEKCKAMWYNSNVTKESNYKRRI